jgi:hypothetical protein
LPRPRRRPDDPESSEAAKPLVAPNTGVEPMSPRREEDVPVQEDIFNKEAVAEPDHPSPQDETQEEVTAAPYSEAPRVPQVRTTYSLWLLFAVWALPSVLLVYFSIKYDLRMAPALIAETVVTGIVAFWWHDMLRTLRERVPPPGWKSEIKPERLVYMSDAEFDAMRFELISDENDGLEEHRVLWASKYSKVAMLWVRLLIVLACICPVGMAFVKRVNVSSGSGLPHEVNIVWLWPLLSVLLLLAAYLVNLDWNYKRLMVDDVMIYALKENPPWMPWLPGKNDVQRLEYVYSADPIDTGWGKRWGHGTVALTIQTGMDQKTIYLRRVPRHRHFCNAVNAMTRAVRGGSGILM